LVWLVQKLQCCYMTRLVKNYIVSLVMDMQAIQYSLLVVLVVPNKLQTKTARLLRFATQDVTPTYTTTIARIIAPITTTAMATTTSTIVEATAMTLPGNHTSQTC
jgi:hypothetical protein